MRGVGAVVVSFRPDLHALVSTVNALAAQVDRLWVVDNGSGALIVGELQQLAQAVGGELIAFDENRGIAAAQNAGIAAAKEAGFAFVLLSDQDSTAAPDMVVQLAASMQQLQREGHRVAAVGARWVDERSGRPGLFYRVRGGRLQGIAPADEAPLRVDFLIASGTLLSMEAVTAIGPMREDLFIDHVDTEWCARALDAGWALYGVPRAQLRHALGDSQRRVWLGRWREVAVHSPLRNYYEVRNTIALLRSPHVPAGWRCVHVVRLVQLLAFYGLLVAPRRERWSAMARGLWHGVTGRWGRWDQSSRASAAR